MKYALIPLLLSVLLALPRPGYAREIPPKYSERLPGSIRLSGGIYLEDAGGSAPVRALADFLREQNITVNTGTPARKNIPVEFRQVGSILYAPGAARNAYSIRMTPARITVEYQTPQAENLACRQLIVLIKKHASTQGLIRKNTTLPCYEVRGWMTDEDLTAFRWTGPGSVVPLTATTVEMRITDPVNGWLCTGNALLPVGYGESLCPGIPFTYTDLETERHKLQNLGLEVTPVFDLSGKNERFEQVTGHPMLSVEGMRFVRVLLEDFFSHTGFSSATFILPEGRYREQVRTIAARYPGITEIRFTED